LFDLVVMIVLVLPLFILISIGLPYLAQQVATGYAR
jgi:hypothetical protein